MNSAEPCSVLSEAVHESAYGTAPHTLGWLAVEQPGPWGRDAVVESHLDARVSAALAGSVRAVGWRLALIRRPGAHPDDHRRRPRRLIIASCLPGREWLLTGEFKDPTTLLSLDVASLERHDHAGVAASSPGLAVGGGCYLLVCTNGRRDVCCALRGRPVAVGAAESTGDRVWETTHTGGHRFAPTGVLLPSGVMFGRLTVDTAAAALRAAHNGDFDLALCGPEHDRGKCGLTPPAQAAESAVRYEIGERRLNALTISELSRSPALSALPGSSDWQVSHVDGRQWVVAVSERSGGRNRPLSCGKVAESQSSYCTDLRKPELE